MNGLRSLSQPVSVTECEDGDVYFAVSAGVTTVPAYQWQIFNGSAWISLNNGLIYSGVNSRYPKTYRHRLIDER